MAPRVVGVQLQGKTSSRNWNWELLDKEGSKDKENVHMGMKLKMHTHILETR